MGRFSNDAGVVTFEGLYRVMSGQSDYDLAEEYAQRIAPFPKHNPGRAGFFGAFVVAASVTVFKVFAGLSPRDFFVASILTVATGFALTFGFVWHERNEHRKAFLAEFARLKRDKATQSKPT